MASVSPKHDTWPLIVASGLVHGRSVLAADQIAEGQYFSYPGRRFRYVAPEYLSDVEGSHPVVPGGISWFTCEVVDPGRRWPTTSSSSAGSRRRASVD